MVIFVGPSYLPVTGQSIAFKYLVENYSGKKSIINYGSEKKSKYSAFISTLRAYFIFVSTLLRVNDINCMYLTTSRSNFGFFRDCLYVLTASLFNLKVVNHLHGADFRQFYYSSGKLKKFFINSVYKKIDSSIVLLPKMKEQYEMFPNMNIYSVSNCAIYNKNIKDKSFDNLNILYLSNIMYSKGILHLIKAVDILIDMGIKVNLDIAGSPMADNHMSEKEIRDNFYAEIHDKNYIRYHGVVHGDKKDSLLLKSNVFVLPTFYNTEAQPISIIEAMLSGNVIITTQHNYLSDFVDNSNGRLVSIKSENSIVEALLTYANNQKLLKETALFNVKFSADTFSVKRYVKQITDIIGR